MNFPESMLLSGVVVLFCVWFLNRRRREKVMCPTQLPSIRQALSADQDDLDSKLTYLDAKAEYWFMLETRNDLLKVGVDGLKILEHSLKCREAGGTEGSFGFNDTNAQFLWNLHRMDDWLDERLSILDRDQLHTKMRHGTKILA